MTRKYLSPSPARIFQALVAGATRGSALDDVSSHALKWLEGLDRPTIFSPAMWFGQRVEVFVPNNDIDTVRGDISRVGEIRSSKTIEPKLFARDVPFHYVWMFEGGKEGDLQAQAICALAERLYQFGRGVDMAWACGEVLDNEALEMRLSSYPGLISRPSGGNGRTLACPEPGSLKSLEERYAANSQRFKTEGQGKAARQLFSQSPKPRFAQVAYESPPSRRIYELRDGAGEASLCVWPLASASTLVVCLRDGSVQRLQQALPERIPEIERVLVGRKANGADEGPTSSRVRLVPLPSIGHPHADRGIRRVLLEVPAGCPVRADDVHWAFSGLELTDPESGEVLILTPSVDESMLVHYGTADRVHSRVWRTVTPAALPVSARRRRIEPTRGTAEAMGGAERAAEQARAAAAVIQALRHVEVRTQVESIRAQHEPFEAKGQRAEAFASGTRFAKERLWHVEITFNAPIAGPLVIGDGRFLGLGVMAPLQRSQGIHAFVVEGGLAATPQVTEVVIALRRAVMARVQDVLGARASLPSFFTGHERDGSPARSNHSHLAFVFDLGAKRLLIIAPHVFERRAPTPKEVVSLASLDAALTQFRELRAGSSGLLTLHARSIDVDKDPFFAASQTWDSVTPYQVTRHTKQGGAAEALSADVRAECRRHGLPEPHVAPRDLRGVPGVGLVGGARLTFETTVKGPIIIGKSRHLGGGVFTGPRLP